ncbi:hypothetical protein [Cribrihabitans pelagius]|uniref:hypothetical protein n=1 Tax=Cribrihabitans pelagius TaxID=1765746 RepID=UPI003B5B4858
MRAFFSLAAAGSLLAVAACAPAVPDSAAGAGLDGDPFAAPPAAGTTITGAPLAAPAQISSEPLAAEGEAEAAAAPGRYASSASASSDDIAREAAAALAASGANSGEAPLQAGPSNPAPPLAGNRAISDENDFEAVSARQSIESDAARLERQRAQYEMVPPEAVPVPERDSGAAPNIVKFALSTSNPKGVRLYSRTGFNLQARHTRNCAGFASADRAQEAFLAAGGPERDRKALDPDGDGFACGWDPAPYRRAVQTAGNG